MPQVKPTAFSMKIDNLLHSGNVKYYIANPGSLPPSMAFSLKGKSFS